MIRQAQERFRIDRARLIGRGHNYLAKVREQNACHFFERFIAHGAEDENRFGIGIEFLDVRREGARAGRIMRAIHDHFRVLLQPFQTPRPARRAYAFRDGGLPYAKLCLLYTSRPFSANDRSCWIFCSRLRR